MQELNSSTGKQSKTPQFQGTRGLCSGLEAKLHEFLDWPQGLTSFWPLVCCNPGLCYLPSASRNTWSWPGRGGGVAAALLKALSLSLARDQAASTSLQAPPGLGELVAVPVGRREPGAARGGAWEVVTAQPETKDPSH